MVDKLIKSLIPVIFFSVVSFAQDSLTTYQMDEDITVTATRIPTAFSEVSRVVTVLSEQEIKKMPAQSVPELLENIVGVDVRQRGTQGMQADISIRGAGFEQTLILINGLKMSDPQTGHHNMNLPLHISDIERIEVLRGPGSRLYGPNAFGGVINIITKKSSDVRAVLGAALAEHNLYDSYVNLYYPFMESYHRLTIAKSGSDGYRPNTDFNNLIFSHNSIIEFGRHALEISSGHNEKKFGASNFYTTRFPEQYEETRLQFLHSAINFRYEDFSIKPQVFYRNHKDKFQLVRGNPDFYQNVHTTNSYGLDLQGHIKTSFGITTFGAELVEEKIDSNNLGRHLRQRRGLFLQQQVNFHPIIVALGTSSYYFSGEGWNMWPGIDIGLAVSNDARLFLSAAQGFRVPTYTELYYQDAATQGNSDLEPEESINLEAGFTVKSLLWSATLSYFFRENENLIDYVQNPADEIFYAQNFTGLITRGLEGSIQLKDPLPYVTRLSAQYTYLNSDLDLNNRVTRYSLTHFERQLMLAAEYLIPVLDNLSQSWTMRYEDRLSTQKQTIFDTRLSWQSNALKLFLDITNILDEKYEDIPGVRMPGRWLKFGFEYQLHEAR